MNITLLVRGDFLSANKILYDGLCSASALWCRTAKYQTNQGAIQWPVTRNMVVFRNFLSYVSSHLFC